MLLTLAPCGRGCREAAGEGACERRKRSLRLRKIFLYRVKIKTCPNKTVVAPNRHLKNTFALTAWRRLYTLDSLDETKITEFIEKYKNRAPEHFPD